MQENQRPFRRLERNDSLLRPRAVIEDSKLRAAALRSNESRFQAEPVVAATNRPQATVAGVSIFEREP